RFSLPPARPHPPPLPPPTPPRWRRPPAALPPPSPSSDDWRLPGSCRRAAVPAFPRRTLLLRLPPSLPQTSGRRPCLPVVGLFCAACRPALALFSPSSPFRLALRIGHSCLVPHCLVPPTTAHWPAACSSSPSAAPCLHWSSCTGLLITTQDLCIDPTPASSALADRNRKTNLSEDDSEPSAPVTSPARKNSGQRLVDRMPVNPKKMVFMSTQEMFVAAQPNDESYSTASPILNVRCNPGDVLFTITLLTRNQIGPGKNISVTPSIISMVLYLDHLHHTRSPPDWLSTPRIRFYNKATIEGLTIVDRIIHEDGSEDYGFLPFKSTSSTCYAAAALHHPWGDPSHFDQQQIPEVQLPRLRDLLSRPLGCLTAPTTHIVERLFDMFDTTIMGNLKSIETLKLLTLRSQLQLADLCRPVLEEIISLQQTNNNPNAGECSTQNAVADDIDSCAHQNDVPPSPVQGHASTSTPQPPSDEDITLSKDTPITLTSDVLHDRFTGDTLTFPNDATRSSSSNVPMGGSTPIQDQLAKATTDASTESSSKESSLPPPNLTSPPENSCGQDSTLDGAVPPPIRIPRYRLCSSRLTKIPPKYCSPFKFGVKSRKPPDRAISVNMLDYVCDYDSPLKNLPVLRFDEMNFSGELIANSFADENFIQSHFIEAFVKCLTSDDFHQRPECHGYRIFLSPAISSCLYDESMERETQEPGFMLAEAVNLIKQCLPDKCDLKKAKMIFLPILDRRRWSVYCVNLGQKRIDVLDSHDYLQSTTSWRHYHDPLANTIIPALSDALSLAAPRQFPCLKNWRRAPVQLAFHKNSNDSGLYAMRFLEYYDGEGHGSLKTTIDPERAKDMRADILYYLCFHTNNCISQFPDDLLKFCDG
ncbi:hypothetical protein U9M48_040473, partial [Paspalum notatum var. saurae]